VRAFTVQQPQESVGIDVLKPSPPAREAEGSNNQVFDAPKPLLQAKTKLAKLQRRHNK